MSDGRRAVGRCRYGGTMVVLRLTKSHSRHQEVTWTKSVDCRTEFTSVDNPPPATPQRPPLHPLIPLHSTPLASSCHITYPLRLPFFMASSPSWLSFPSLFHRLPPPCPPSLSHLIQTRSLRRPPYSMADPSALPPSNPVTGLTDLLPTSSLSGGGGLSPPPVSSQDSSSSFFSSSPLRGGSPHGETLQSPLRSLPPCLPLPFYPPLTHTIVQLKSTSSRPVPPLQHLLVQSLPLLLLLPSLCPVLLLPLLLLPLRPPPLPPPSPLPCLSTTAASSPSSGVYRPVRLCASLPSEVPSLVTSALTLATSSSSLNTSTRTSPSHLPPLPPTPLPTPPTPLPPPLPPCPHSAPPINRASLLSPLTSRSIAGSPAPPLHSSPSACRPSSLTSSCQRWTSSSWSSPSTTSPMPVQPLT